MSYKIYEINELIGGVADKLTINDIAKKFNVTHSFITYQIQKGVKIEMEHTNDIFKAMEIATDHVAEFPDYYDRLEKMENKANLYWNNKNMNENSKKLIKKLLREELEEGSLTNAIGGLAMVASTMASANPKIPNNKPSIEHNKEYEIGVRQESNGVYSSTVETNAPTSEFAKELAITKAKNQILEKLKIDKGSVEMISIVKEKTYKSDKGGFVCMLTITAKLK